MNPVRDLEAAAEAGAGAVLTPEQVAAVVEYVAGLIRDKNELVRAAWAAAPVGVSRPGRPGVGL